jgi:hypothetical protein
MPTG